MDKATLNFDNIPDELKNRKRWVVCDEFKVPINALTKNKASSTYSSTWCDFDKAVSVHRTDNFKGIGFVLGDSIAGVDIDHCFKDGKPKESALKLLEEIGCTYIEISISGDGLHGLGLAKSVSSRSGYIGDIKIEMYPDKRYFVMTGNTILSNGLSELKGWESVRERITSKSTEETEVTEVTEDIEDTECNSSVSSDSSVAELIGESILPSQFGERNRKIFLYARKLKGMHPESCAEDHLEDFKIWHQNAEPFIRTKDFGLSWVDFKVSWNSVKYPAGEVMRKVLENLPELSDEAYEKVKIYGEQGIYLTKVCKGLQINSGDECFFLANRVAGDLLGIHFTMAGRLLKALQIDSIITLVSLGQGNKASRFKFNF